MKKFMGNEVEDQQESNFFCSWDEATLTAKLPAPEQCPHEVIRVMVLNAVLRSTAPNELD